MKKTLSLLFLAAALTSFAADVTPLTRLLINRHNIGVTNSRRAQGEQTPYIPMILQIAGDEVLADLENLGVIVFNRRADLLLASLPYNSVQEVLSLDGVVNGQSTGDMSSCLDKARPYGHIDEAHSGADGLTQRFDGSGVVVGMSDIGFDPGHIAFADGRLREIHTFDGFSGTSRSATTPAQIADWEIDTADEFHGTHVCGILAGSYSANGYQGVATGADIVATTSHLSDVGILSGVESIIDYAKRNNKPAVVNISMANYMGPHDGSDLECQYLSHLAEDAIICISAGNTGDEQGYATHRFTESRPETRVRLNNLYTWNAHEVDGYADIWSADSSPLWLRIEVYDDQMRQVVHTSEWIAGDTGINHLLIDFGADPEWSQYLAGAIEAYAEISPLNGRHNISLAYAIRSELNTEGHTWARYWVSVAVKGNPGQAVDMYADTTTSFFQSTAITPSPVSSNCCINNMCTAPGIVSVGALVSRDEAPAVDGSELSWNVTTDAVGKFSSYSTSSASGLTPRLPHFCAPGQYLVAPMSGPYYEAHKDEDIQPSSLVTDSHGKQHRWIALAGTSMASPYAAGVIAMWLQVDPTLKSADVIRLAQSTARTDFADINNPRWGAGAIDAVAGLKDLTTSSLTNICYSQSEDDTAPVEIYTLEGRRINAPSTNSLPAGIYILRQGSRTSKFLK